MYKKANVHHEGVVRLLIATLAATSLLVACGPEERFVDSGPQTETIASAITGAGRDANPLYLLKQSDVEGYEVGPQMHRLLESICLGASDLQFVEAYDGRYTEQGFDTGFVDELSRSVGALEIEASESPSVKYCSGTLIDRNLFLTASHCVGINTVGHFVAFNYQQVGGSSELRPQQHYAVAEIVEDGNEGLDYAILRLDGAPGDSFGFTRFRPHHTDGLAIIQHPEGGPKQVDAGHMGSVTTDLLQYGDIDTLGGSSGSGILSPDGFLVGVHTYGGCDSPQLNTNAGYRMQRIYGSSPTLRSLQWTRLAGQARDIGVGADGSAWIIGNTPVGGGYSIHRFVPSTNDWVTIPGGAVRIAVAPDGTPWVVNSGQQIFRRNGNRWQLMPGRARDIGIGADGSVWVIQQPPG